MRLRVGMFGFAFCIVLAISGTARAGDDALNYSMMSRFAARAPLDIPHTTDLELARKARKRNRRPDNIESSALFDVEPGLEPVTWPRNSDVRARWVTPELRRTPIVGWIAENLYRSRKDSGWCLEVDPGEGEYVVFYRRHL
jgi:hypothetical protein